MTLPAWALKGNIVYGNWYDNLVTEYFGHTGGISVEALLCGTTNVILSNTKSIEAHKAAPNAGVTQKFMDQYGWTTNSIFNRSAMWKSGMTATQRNFVAAYQATYIGKSYFFYTGKTDLNKWYCSKLQWYAYKQALGIDVDSNGGDIVFPTDILNSPLLVGMSF